MGKKYWVIPSPAAKVIRLGVLVTQLLKSKKNTNRQEHFKKNRISFPKNLGNYSVIKGRKICEFRRNFRHIKINSGKFSEVKNFQKQTF
jgi:hypothetical protein